VWTQARPSRQDVITLQLDKLGEDSNSGFQVITPSCYCSNSNAEYLHTRGFLLPLCTVSNLFTIVYFYHIGFPYGNVWHSSTLITMTKASLHFLSSSNLCKLQQNLHCGLMQYNTLGIGNLSPFYIQPPPPPPPPSPSFCTYIF
jgi:hypothetical protein